MPPSMHSFAVFLSLFSVCLAKTITYTWSVDFVTAAPDGFSRQVIGINGAWPCPTIEGNVGDRVVIHLTNNLGTQSTGLHFHGLNQPGTQTMDGPSWVTQCPIPPGNVFTYDFIVCLRNVHFGKFLTTKCSSMFLAHTGITLIIWDSTLTDFEV